MIRTTARALAAALLFALPLPAFAHVTLETRQAEAGSTYKAVLRIPHGCGAEATHTVKVQIPEGLFSVKPMPKAGWALDTVIAAYEKSYDDHGSSVTEGVREIIWSGGNLPDAHYDEFVFRGTLARDIRSDTKLYFPTLQLCANGEEAWTDVSGMPEAEMPAPSLTIIAAQAAHPHAEPQAIVLDTLSISGGFARATLPNAPVGGGYLTIVNTGAEGDRLVSAESPVAGTTQLHQMTMTDGVMRMSELPDGIDIPAGATVELKPGGLHIMFMSLRQQLTEGSTVPVTLTFEKAGTVEIGLTVGPVDAASQGNGHAHRH